MPWAILGVGFSMVMPQAQLNAELEDIYREHGDSFVVYGEMNSDAPLRQHDLRKFEIVVTDKRPVVVRLPAGRGFVEYWDIGGEVLRVAGSEFDCTTLSLERAQDDVFSLVCEPESLTYLLLLTLARERAELPDSLFRVGEGVGPERGSRNHVWEQLSSRAGMIGAVSLREVTAQDVVIRPGTSILEGATVYAGLYSRLGPTTWASRETGHLLTDPQLAYIWLNERIENHRRD